MMNDPYSPCPCGSGKKFKWCCQPIHDQIARIYNQDESGQHEAALRAMDDLVAQHSENPEAWGRKAQLLFQNEKPEEAEKALEKAFALFPNYPFGYFLKGRFRLYEGEIGGALILFRKAAEFYDPQAADILAQIYIEIFNCEMKLNHPLAARAAAEMALRHNPSSEQLRKGLDRVFGDENINVPATGRRLLSFKSLPADATQERRQAWEAALKTAASGKLSDAVRAFERLTQADGVEPAAWYNLGVTQAWLGMNGPALEAFDQYVKAEPDEKEAAKAWAIAEVLRFGQGMEDLADTVEHSITFGVHDPQALVNELGELEKAGLLAGVQIDEQTGMLRATILEPAGPALTSEMEANQSMKPAAKITLVQNFVQMGNSHLAPLENVFQRLQQKLGDRIVQAHTVRGPAPFVDALLEAITIPPKSVPKEQYPAAMGAGFEKYFEEVWIHRPRKSLDNVAPIDAAGSPVLRKKLSGLLIFLGDCLAMTRYPYDIDRLSRKLGLVSAPATDGKRDITALSAADLAALPIDTLGSAELDQAYTAAFKLDARELAAKFATQLVARPAYPERPDRFPLFQLLINQAVAGGNYDSAMDWINEGEADDCKANEGRRRNEYELRRAQLHAKRGEFDDAERVYDGLISRAPTEFNYRVNAAETMLSNRQGPKALKYAKEGLALAVKQNNRDHEGHFKDLVKAAEKR